MINNLYKYVSKLMIWPMYLKIYHILSVYLLININIIHEVGAIFAKFTERKTLTAYSSNYLCETILRN